MQILHLFHRTESVILKMNSRCMSVALETKTKVSTVHVLSHALVKVTEHHLGTIVRSGVSIRNVDTRNSHIGNNYNKLR